MNKWIDVNDELPLEDGHYFVTNFPNDARDEGIAFYDGRGFLYLGTYRNPKFWRKCLPIPKKYGKQK